MAQQDKEQKFAPFWKVYLDGNPLSPTAAEQLTQLKQLGVRIHQ